MGGRAGCFFVKATVDPINFLISSVSLEVETGVVFSGSSSVNGLEDKLLLGSVFEANSLLEIAVMGTPSKARGLNESLDRVVCRVGVLLRTCLGELSVSWFGAQS